MFQNGKTLSRRNYCLFNLLFQQNCVVFCLSDKNHVRALARCRFYSKCCSTITVICAAMNTSLAKRREDVHIQKNGIENKHQAKPLSTPLKNMRIWLHPKNAREKSFLGLQHGGKLLNTQSNVSTVCPPVWFRTK